MLKSNQLDNKLVLIKANQLEQLTRCTEAVLSAGGKPILVGSDINNLSKIVERIEKKYSKKLFFSEINSCVSFGTKDFFVARVFFFGLVRPCGIPS